MFEMGILFLALYPSSIWIHRLASLQLKFIFIEIQTNQSCNGLNCKCISYGCVFFLAFWQKAASDKSSTLYIAKCYNVRINKSIHKYSKINANLLKIQDPRNTEHAKYNMFTVTCAN